MRELLISQPAYLEPKGEGDNSMLVKQERREDAEIVVLQDLRDMVKAILPEAQSRRCIWPSTPTASKRSIVPRYIFLSWMYQSLRNESPGNPPGQRMSGPPTVTLLSYHFAQSTGWPKGREPYGHRAPIVVRARESRVHGEGGQVSWHTKKGGARDA